MIIDLRLMIGKYARLSERFFYEGTQSAKEHALWSWCSSILRGKKLDANEIKKDDLVGVANGGSLCRS